MIDKLKRYVKKIWERPFFLLYKIVKKLPPSLISDKRFIEVDYYYLNNKRLDWKNPQTFNEKLQWLKIYGDNQKYAEYVDKQKVKDKVKELIGEDKIIPTLAVYASVDDIDFDKLPNQFVLKCTHDSGSVVVCKDKSQLDIDKVKSKLRQCLEYNWYTKFRETPYKYITPMIIAEKYMKDESTGELRDYKFLCFNGVVESIQLDMDRFGNFKRNFYTPQWEFFPCRYHYENSLDVHITRPENLDEMIDCATKLSKGFPFVRVDLYSVNGKTYFGEMTFYCSGARRVFVPLELNDKYGNMINLDI